MQDIGGSFYIVLPTTIMLVLLQGKEKNNIPNPWVDQMKNDHQNGG